MSVIMNRGIVFASAGFAQVRSNLSLNDGWVKCVSTVHLIAPVRNVSDRTIQGAANMAKAKTTKQTSTSAHKASAGNGQVQEKLTNKAEAIRRALAKLGNKAK